MSFPIGSNVVGDNHPIYVVAELSGNHNQSLEKALDIVRAAKDCGANAIKVQTYTADTLTINCSNEYFRIAGTIWEGKTLYELYREASTPWEWHEQLRNLAERLDLDFIATPFDSTAVSFLSDLDVDAFKIASFENTYMELVEQVAQQGRPVILSTGMATIAELSHTVDVLKRSGAEFALLKCTSSYPAPPSDCNLRTIPHMRELFRVPIGLSDHTLGTSMAIAATVLGACVIEKHLTISRDEPGPDSLFSLEPAEFADMVDSIRTLSDSLGAVFYGATASERRSLVFRRSIFAVEDIGAGEPFTRQNTRCIRPGYGLEPRYISLVLSRTAAVNMSRGTPLQWEHIGGLCERGAKD